MLTDDDIFIACLERDSAMLQRCVNDGTDVNGRNHETRPVWEVLLSGRQEENAALTTCLKILLQGGLRLDRLSQKGFSLTQFLRPQLPLCAQVLIEMRGMDRVRRAVDSMDRGAGGAWWETRAAQITASQLEQSTSCAPILRRSPRL